jgi:hypothetical protein
VIAETFNKVKNRPDFKSPIWFEVLKTLFFMKASAKDQDHQWELVRIFDESIEQVLRMISEIVSFKDTLPVLLQLDPEMTYDKYK